MAAVFNVGPLSPQETTLRTKANKRRVTIFFMCMEFSAISDNIGFHGMVESNERIENRNLRQLVNKIRNYIDYLKENKKFTTEFYKIGDGISVSIKN